MSKAESLRRQITLKQLEKLNPDDSLTLDHQGLIRMKRKDLTPIKLPENWKCEEGTYCTTNTISLRHIYSENDTFIITLVVYQNA